METGAIPSHQFPIDGTRPRLHASVSTSGTPIRDVCTKGMHPRCVVVRRSGRTPNQRNHLPCDRRFGSNHLWSWWRRYLWGQSSTRALNANGIRIVPHRWSRQLRLVPCVPHRVVLYFPLEYPNQPIFPMNCVKRSANRAHCPWEWRFPLWNQMHQKVGRSRQFVHYHYPIATLLPVHRLRHRDRHARFI